MDCANIVRVIIAGNSIVAPEAIEEDTKTVNTPIGFCLRRLHCLERSLTHIGAMISEIEKVRIR